MSTKKGQMKYVVVAIDYSTKCIEVESLQKIIKKRTTNFIWRSVICKYGIPQAIITDNGTQLNNVNFKKFYAQLSIELQLSSPTHLNANEQVEVVKKFVKQLLKKRFK